MEMRRQQKFRRKISLLVFLFAMIPFVILGGVYVSREYANRVHRVTEGFEKDFRVDASNLNNLFEANYRKLDYVNNNSSLYGILTRDYFEYLPDVYSLFQYVRESFNAFNNIDRYGNIIKIYPLDDKVYVGEYSGTLDSLDSEIRDAVMKDSSAEVLCRFRTLPDETRRIDTEYFCFYKPIFFTSAKGQTSMLAFSELRLPAATVSRIFTVNLPENSFIAYQAPDNAYRFVLKANRIDSRETGSLLNRFADTGHTSRHIVTTQQVPATGGRVYLFLSRQHIERELQTFFLPVLSALLVLVLAVSLSARAVSIVVTRRLNTLLDQTGKDVETLIESDLKPFLTWRDEFGQLGLTIHSLIQSIKEHYSKNLLYEMEKKSLELSLLQERINPHLLYNTLSAIKWAFPEPRLGQVIDNMVRYYRIVLNRGNEIIKLRDEVELIQEYVKLQKFTYRGEYTFDVHVEEAALDVTIPKNLLQPFMENAILHGVSIRKESGRIGLSAICREDSLVLEIADNGMGMDRERVEQILTGTYHGSVGGYGIRNVMKRLELFYQGKAEICISSERGAGTTVTVDIPLYAIH